MPISVGTTDLRNSSRTLGSFEKEVRVLDQRKARHKDFQKDIDKAEELMRNENTIHAAYDLILQTEKSIQSAIDQSITSVNTE